MMKQEPTFRLGDAVFDPGRGTLNRAGEIVLLRAKTFSLLAYLVGNANRVIGKDELLEAVWPDTTVTEDSLTQCIRDVRKAIGDENKSIIRTVPRRGYMVVQTISQALPLSRDALGGRHGQVPTEPHIVVLPFRLDGTREALRPLFEGVVEGVTAALAHGGTRVLGTRYMAMNAVQVLSGHKRGTHLDEGTDYLVEVEVSGAHPMVNVAVALTDIRAGGRGVQATESLQPASRSNSKSAQIQSR